MKARTAATAALLLVCALALAACSGVQRRGEPGEGWVNDAGRVALWCQQPKGAACAQARKALGAEPQAPEALPPAALGPILDGEDDCAQPGTATVLATLAEALAIDPGNWHDNIGREVGAASVPETFAGGGCTNCCWDEQEPAVKVHAVRDGDGLRFLVRVWER
jgi:hypothetical protein